jgi:2-methylcitrate dehydratase PrpD
MTTSHIQQFAAFAVGAPASALPPEVADDVKRIILDTVGCALAAGENPTARHGVDYARILGGSTDEATIIGSNGQTSVHGAAFANAELSSALDMHAINLPAHVAPYGVPIVLALGESLRRPGIDAIAAVAVCLEMSHRFSQAMDRNRDVKDGKADTSPVLGYANIVFGLTAAATIMKRMDERATANALAIAGATSPVNAHRAWLMHTPTATTKYNLMPGGVVMTALNAAYMAELGHRGDLQIVDDAEFGYPRFIGTRRWEPSRLTENLGEEWGFVAASQIKPYPHCRVTHAVFDAITDLVVDNDIQPSEIVSLTAYGEAWAAGTPTFMNRTIERPFDAQWSFPHGIAMAAHLVPRGKEWQDPEIVYSESVMELMSKVEWRSHPDWAEAVAADPVARPTRVEIVARGTTFVGERRYARGSRTPDESTYITTDELIDKFRHNAEGSLNADQTERVIETSMTLETTKDVAVLMALLRPTSGPRPEVKA